MRVESKPEITSADVSRRGLLVAMILPIRQLLQSSPCKEEPTLSVLMEPLARLKLKIAMERAFEQRERQWPSKRRDRS